MPKKAVLDNDFLMHCVELKKCPDPCDLFLRFLNALGLEAIMHPLVYEKETVPYLKNCCPANGALWQLFDGNEICIPPLEDCDFTQDKRKYYQMMVKNIYQAFMGTPFPCNDVFSEWKANHSLGEVHSVVLCMLWNYDTFLSDDKKVSKELGQVVKARGYTLKIACREDCCTYLKNREHPTLSSSELRLLNHMP